MTPPPPSDAPKDRVCKHLRRRPYDSGWSIGDSSDYISKCLDCGQVLREEPNA
jgi:hypothetical protein